jgi:hypothetical protein
MNQTKLDIPKNREYSQHDQRDTHRAFEPTFCLFKTYQFPLKNTPKNYVRVSIDQNNQRGIFTKNWGKEPEYSRNNNHQQLCTYTRVLQEVIDKPREKSESKRGTRNILD